MRVYRSIGPILLLLVASAAIYAQQISKPELRLRSDKDATAQEQQPQDSTSHSQSTLPADVSGAYEFGHRDESIEIDLAHNKLTGYISQRGDAETDSDTPLTFFFDRASVDGSQIRFQTKVVHGIWYSFHGTIFRGDAETRDQEGYYVLHGVLLVHHPQGGLNKSANETIETRHVNFKSLGQ